MNKSFWKSRTFWGTVIVAVARVVGAQTTQERAQTSIEGIGAVVAAIGVREAIAKNGAGQ